MWYKGIMYVYYIYENERMSIILYKGVLFIYTFAHTKVI